MNLFQEYELQQKRRNWEYCLRFIPVTPGDLVVDLGCSNGYVSRLFALRVRSVFGCDINRDFIDYCNSRKIANETFACADFRDVGNLPLESAGGVWSSFSLSYLPDPAAYFARLGASLPLGSWIALVDVSCFISGNLAPSSKYHGRVRNFELESSKSGVYDFAFGSKMRSFLQSAGFEILHEDNDVTDAELNFSGKAEDEVIELWKARLKRMQRLRDELGSEYAEFCGELLDGLRSELHEKRENVRFVVARNLKSGCLTES